MTRTPMKAVISLLLVFASGIVVGVVSHRLYETSSVAAKTNGPRTLAEFRQRYLDGMRQNVGITDDQVAKVNALLDETKQRFDGLRAQEKPAHDRMQAEQIDRMHAILTPEQIVKYDKWREERARRAAEKKSQTN